MEKNTYNELVYKSNPFSYATARKVEAYATLYGLNPTDSRKARILELGSSFGGNILTQALYNPDNYYVGVDLSEEQVNIGKKFIEQLGLKNIELHQKDILEIDEDFGKFDYVISHGVFSWVPDVVKEKMIWICNHNLNENGVAYLSYNTLPGWKEGEKIREMMLYVNKYFPEKEQGEKVRRGKVFMEIIAEQMKLYPNISERKKNFIELAESIIKMDDYYIGHEHLEVFNDPMYLYQFVEMLEKEDLQYITDIDLRLSYSGIYRNETKEKIQQLSLGDNVIKEQVLDYLLDTQFRKSVICKKSQREKLNFSESIPNDIIDSFYYTPSFTKEEIGKEGLLFDALNDIIDKGELFKVEDVKKFLKKKKAKNEEIEEAIKNLRVSLLNSMIYGKVGFFNSKYDIVKFEENKTYIPEKFRKYAELMVGEGRTYISPANFDNQMLNNYNIVDFAVIKEFDKPKTKKQILDILKQINIEKVTNGERTKVSAEDYYDECIRNIESYGYFVKK